jgi:hypothetical protein
MLPNVSFSGLKSSTGRISCSNPPIGGQPTRFADPQAERPTFDMTPPPAQYGIAAAVAVATAGIERKVEVRSLLSAPIVPPTKIDDPDGSIKKSYVGDLETKLTLGPADPIDAKFAGEVEKAVDLVEPKVTSRGGYKIVAPPTSQKEREMLADSDIGGETPEQRKRRLNTERSRRYRLNKRAKAQEAELAARRESVESADHSHTD